MLINGSAGYLDTRTALPDLTGPDRAVLAAMKDSARAARAAEAAALREIWIAGRVDHAVTPKTVYLLSNLPLPGIRPDLLVTMDKLLLPGRLAEVMLRDKAITGQAMLAKRHPDLFENEKAAKEVLARLQSPIPLLVILIGKRAIEEPAALVAQDYRAGHQRGGKPRRALLYETADPASLLAALHGEPVTLCESAEAPEAQPVTAAAPIETTTAPPPPAPENPAMPELNPSTDPVVATRAGIGNILWMIGSPFFADWDRTEEVRSVVWTVTMIDGKTCTLRLPENPGYAEAYDTARRVVPTMHHIAAPRAYA